MFYLIYLGFKHFNFYRLLLFQNLFYLFLFVFMYLKSMLFSYFIINYV